MEKTALLFAGQGAQAVGMGKDLAAAYPSARALFDRADAVLGYDLAGICFDGPEAELTKTENAQPGIYLVSWVALALLKERVPGLEFQAAAGLSLGEFTALAAAGAMSFEDGLKVVRLRGRSMQEACEATQGGMAAIIGLDEGPTREICAEAGVELANLNCPGQLVISGEADKITKACEFAKARGAKRVVAYCTHPIFSGPAIERIANGSALDEVVVTNTIPLSVAAMGCKKIRQLTVAPLIAETIQRIAKGESVMSLFSDQDDLF